MTQQRNLVTKVRAGVVEGVGNSWVMFPNAKEYLLPVVSKYETVVPKFNDDGTITMNSENCDPELFDLLQKFGSIMESAEKDALTLSREALATFFLLIRNLISKNYDLSNEEMSTILTVNTNQLGMLFSAIAVHLVRAA